MTSSTTLEEIALQMFVHVATFLFSGAYLLPSLRSDQLHCLALSVNQDKAFYRALDDECIPNCRAHIIWKAQHLRTDDMMLKEGRHLRDKSLSALVEMRDRSCQQSALCSCCKHTHDQSLFFLSDQCLQTERFQSFILLPGLHMCTLKATKDGSMCTGGKASLAFLLLIHSMSRCYTKWRLFGHTHPWCSSNSNGVLGVICILHSISSYNLKQQRYAACKTKAAPSRCNAACA